MSTPLRTIGEIYTFLWRRNLWWMIPFVGLLTLLALPVLIFWWPIRFLVGLGGRRGNRARLERDLKRQGKDLYPLW